MSLLPKIVLFAECQRGVSSPLASVKVLCLQQSLNCCNMTQLTQGQRYQIWALRHLKPAQIAHKIGKHRSVVTREIARNGPTIKDYKPETAQKQAAERKKPMPLKLPRPSMRPLPKAWLTNGHPTRLKAALTNRAYP